MYGNLKRYEEAITAYEKAIELDATSVYPHNGLGNVYRDLKRYEEAITAYEKAIELDATFAYPYNGLGNVYRDLKRYEEAITAYEKAIELDATFAYPHNGLGNVYRDLKRYEEAITAYEKTIELDATYATPHNGLGNVYGDLKRYEEAITAYEKAIELDATYAYSYNGLGYIYFLKQRNEDALKAINEAIGLKPDFSYAFANRSRVKLLEGDTDAALADIVRALELEPENQEFLLLKSSIRMQRDEEERAAETYKQLGELSPQMLQQMKQAFSPSQSEEAQSLQRKYLEQISEATGVSVEDMMDEVKRFLQMVEDNPENAAKIFQYQAIISEAALLEKNSEYQNAIDVYQQAVELFPEDSYSRFRLGLSYSLQGQTEQAQAAIVEVMDLFKSDLQDLLSKALCKLILGRPEQGLQQLQELLQQNISPKTIQSILADANLLTHCPNPPEGLDDFIANLREALGNQTD
ncbi:MAG: tetratricopeptide repeat protein [Leptolyngbya sp. SIO1D8]|nr:tetratricopeptide repeat protein [Leptolyngbya sp. SIO1D8]